MSSEVETSLTISVPLLVLVEQFGFGAYNRGSAKRLSSNQKSHRRLLRRTDFLVMSSEVETSLTVVCETQRRPMTKDLPRIQNFIGGEVCEPHSARLLRNNAPATGKTDSH